MRAAALCLLLFTSCGRDARVVVGSKAFTESVVLGELLTQLVRGSNVPVQHRAELGGSRVLFEALLNGEIDAYPEYTGTLREELLAENGVRDWAEMEAALERRGLKMSAPLGFNNTYAVAVRGEVARRLGLERISDLLRHPGLRLGFSNEFLARGDGWPALRRRYGLPHAEVRGMDHDLVYRALESGALDGADVYSTDAELAQSDLVVLEDDRGHFPEYRAVVLYRRDLAERSPAAVSAIRRLEGHLSARQMIALNARAKLERVPAAEVARVHLAAAFDLSSVRQDDESLLRRVLRTTGDHLVLVGLSLGLAIVFAIPLGVFASRGSWAGRTILTAVGTIQTIPSLALLVFMIPLLGIGTGPAVMALFLYALLPIVRGTYTGLSTLPIDIRESAAALGLPAYARLRRIELPLATPAIFSGIKTSAVITVGTATLGALVGAGGYGQPILTGIRLADAAKILEGAAPAAALALAVQALFGVLERRIVPRGLRL